MCVCYKTPIPEWHVYSVCRSEPRINSFLIVSVCIYEEEWSVDGFDFCLHSDMRKEVRTCLQFRTSKLFFVSVANKMFDNCVGFCLLKYLEMLEIITISMFFI